MESEERPAKIRKLGHTSDDVDSVITDTPATTILDDQSSMNAQNGESNGMTEAIAEDAAGGRDVAPKISKNQLKKQRRHEQWEAGREDRKLKRKEKIKQKKERRREAVAQGKTDLKLPPLKPPRHSAGFGTQVPITIVFDCDFEDFMFDNELKSLDLQITRCYSDNRKAKFRTHLALSSFGGKMKERFDGILARQYINWKGFRFFEEDFVAVAEKSKEWMAGPNGGEIGGALKQLEGEQVQDDNDKAENADGEGETIYLSAESDNILTHLKPNCTYIIGGLVDKNRHKGLCHKRAVNRGMKTAKLPIGEFLEMKSRQVLTTNHVAEIMFKWLEFGDWGKAFMEVLPKRKGGKLREDGEGGDDDDGMEDEEQDQVDEELADAARRNEEAADKLSIEAIEASLGEAAQAENEASKES